ncbi:hypothetical protein Btus_1168 [Kyrpidia tusciae DSM 2912]|uniref:Uncharacterized protein n=1 Tax=Kyrpidia tusciae (strain DSM 2912 / NBRC 15312 / T2) TaxID=562970 RepID=D5WXH7_KYRT2|nr:hypothetical protein Btus_1168 [Kyrpidia tusciae DSM 2912]
MPVYDVLETPVGTVRVVVDRARVSRVTLTEENW